MDKKIFFVKFHFIMETNREICIKIISANQTNGDIDLMVTIAFVSNTNSDWIISFRLLPPSESLVRADDTRMLKTFLPVTVRDFQDSTVYGVLMSADKCPFFSLPIYLIVLTGIFPCLVK